MYFLLGIYVKLKGDGFVKFGENSANEEYLEKRLYVYGNGSDIKLPVGQYTLPFSFALPYDLPSSFQGIINYKVDIEDRQTERQTDRRTDRQTDSVVKTISFGLRPNH